MSIITKWWPTLCGQKRCTYLAAVASSSDCEMMPADRRLLASRLCICLYKQLMEVSPGLIELKNIGYKIYSLLH